MLGMLIGLALLAQPTCAPSIEPRPERNLRVVVTDSSKTPEPVPGATVTIVPENHSGQVQGAADATGTFGAALALGAYKVTVGLPGFKTQSQRIVIAPEGASKDVVVFRLKVDMSNAVILDCGAPSDHLREPGTWRITAHELERLPGY